MGKELRLLMVVPRFHSNLIGLDRVLGLSGATVLIVVGRQGPSESVPVSDYMFLPENLRTAEVVGKIVAEFRPNLLIQRDFSGRSAQFWDLCEEIGVATVSYDQGPSQVGATSFLFQPFITLRFLLSHALRRKKVRNYRRITPVKRWGSGMSFPVSNSMYAAHPMLIPTSRDPKLSQTSRRVEVIVVAKHGQARKRVRWLVKAQSQSKTFFALTIVGSRPETAKTRRRHQRLIRSVNKNLSRGFKVRVVSDIRREQVLSAMSQSSLFVLPSHSEPFSVSVLEAMALGVPALVSNTGGAACYIEPGKNGGKFWVWSFRSFRGQLENLLENLEGLSRMGIGAKEKIARECNGEDFLQILLGLAKKSVH